MPGDPKECRMRARRCTELAAQATDPLKTKFTELASKWTQLAVDLESALALTAQDVGPTHAHRHRAAHVK
jgi:hypothetical protein